jgi:hypothetical protein
MSIKLKENKDQVKDLVNKIKEMARRLPEVERKFIIGKLQQLNLANVIDLINVVNNWYWNGKYKDFESRIKSHLFDIHTCLKRLETILRNEAKKAKLLKDIFNIAEQLPKSDEKDIIKGFLESQKMNQENLEVLNNDIANWLNSGKYGDLQELMEDSFLKIQDLIENLLEIFKGN